MSYEIYDITEHGENTSPLPLHILNERLKVPGVYSAELKLSKTEEQLAITREFYQLWYQYTENGMFYRSPTTPDNFRVLQTYLFFIKRIYRWFKEDSKASKGRDGHIIRNLLTPTHKMKTRLQNSVIEYEEATPENYKRWERTPGVEPIPELKTECDGKFWVEPILEMAVEAVYVPISSLGISMRYEVPYWSALKYAKDTDTFYKRMAEIIDTICYKLNKYYYQMILIRLFELLKKNNCKPIIQGQLSKVKKWDYLITEEGHEHKGKFAGMLLSQCFHEGGINGDKYHEMSSLYHKCTYYISTKDSPFDVNPQHIVKCDKVERTVCDYSFPNYLHDINYWELQRACRGYDWEHPIEGGWNISCDGDGCNKVVNIANTDFTVIGSRVFKKFCPKIAGDDTSTRTIMYYSFKDIHGVDTQVGISVSKLGIDYKRYLQLIDIFSSIRECYNSV